MNITYRTEGDYLIPNIFANEEPEQTLTKYGMLRESFLKNNHKGIYTGKLLAGTLKEHCLDIQEQAENMVEKLTSTLSFPMCIQRSLEPFPYINIVPSCKFTSFTFREHNSDIRIPVENSSSITAISRIAFLR